MRFARAGARAAPESAILTRRIALGGFLFTRAGRERAPPDGQAGRETGRAASAAKRPPGTIALCRLCPPQQHPIASVDVVADAEGNHPGAVGKSSAGRIGPGPARTVGSPRP